MAVQMLQDAPPCKALAGTGDTDCVASGRRSMALRAICGRCLALPMHIHTHPHTSTHTLSHLHTLSLRVYVL
jgi:hypothetical protein